MTTKEKMVEVLENAGAKVSLLFVFIGIAVTHEAVASITAKNPQKFVDFCKNHETIKKIIDWIVQEMAEQYILNLTESDIDELHSMSQKPSFQKWNCFAIDIAKQVPGWINQKMEAKQDKDSVKILRDIESYLLEELRTG